MGEEGFLQRADFAANFTPTEANCLMSLPWEYVHELTLKARVGGWLTLLNLINMRSTVSGGVCVWEGRNDLAHHDVTAVICPFSYACYIVLSQGL